MDPTTESLTTPVPENATGAALLCRVPFYVTGGTLPPSASSYVERDADGILLSALECGEFCYVLNTRQMGKSSLMARTASLLRHSGATVIVLDLTAVGQNLSAAQWYNGLLASVGEQLGLEDAAQDYWHRHADAGPMQRFLGALRDVALPAVPGALVLFIDEIDAVRSLPFPTDELFAGIRELYNRRTQDPALNRLTFCLLGVATPPDLIRDTRTTPFNIGVRIGLDDFTSAEAAPLAQGMFGGRAVLGRVLHWTGGHPYLTQRLCRAIADDPQAVTKPAQVDALCERLFFCPSARDTEDNLLFVRERVLRSGPDPAALLTLYARVLRGRTAVMDDPADPLASALKLAGVVKADASGRLWVRNRIYARVFGRAWVRENMPGAEVRRQRRAFRRGALRAGLIGAVLIAVIGTLAGVAVKEAHVARAANQKAQAEATKLEKLLYVSDMQNAQSAWDNGNLGHLRALLSQTKDSPQRGWEWGYWNRLAYPSGDVINPGDGPLSGLGITPDGTLLLTAGGNGMLRLWDARTLRLVRSVHYAGAAITVLCFSVDGTRFYAGDGAGGLAAFGKATGKTLFSLPPRQSGVTNSLSPDCKAVILNTHKGTTVKRTDTGRVLADLPNRGDTAFANRAPKFYVFTAKPFGAALYSEQTGARLCRLFLRPANRHDTGISAQFADDDRTLVTTGDNSGSVDLWNAQTGQFVRHLFHRNDDDSVLVDTHAPIALAREETRLREYSTVTGRKILDTAWPDIKEVFGPTGFSPDGRYLGYVGTNGGVFLLDCKTGTRSADFLGHVSRVIWLSFLPGGNTFFTASTDGTLRRWNIRQTAQPSWQTVRFPHGAVGTRVAPNRIWLSHEERRALTFDGRQTLTLWSISQNRAQLLSVLTTQLCDLSFSDDRSFLVCGILPRGTETVYDYRDGRVMGSGLADPDSTYFQMVSSSGRRLATVSASGATSVFDVGSGARLWRRAGSNSAVYHMNFSPSSRLLGSSGGERVVDIWDTETGRTVAALRGLDAPVTNFIFLPGDRRVITDGQDQTLRCWDIATGRCVWAAQEPNAQTTFLSISPDGRRLLASPNSGMVGVWDTQTGDLLLTLYVPGREPHPRFLPDGRTLDVTNDSGHYVHYIADFRPHDDPRANAVSP